MQKTCALALGDWNRSCFVVTYTSYTSAVSGLQKYQSWSSLLAAKVNRKKCRQCGRSAGKVQSSHGVQTRSNGRLELGQNEVGPACRCVKAGQSELENQKAKKKSLVVLCPW